MKGPCLCGDPYCPSCGNPAAAAYADAVGEAMDEMQRVFESNNFTPAEIKMVQSLAMRAVISSRKITEQAIKDYQAAIAENEAERKAMEAEQAYWSTARQDDTEPFS